MSRIIFLAATAVALAQQPDAPRVQAVRNAASFAAPPFHAVAAGSIATIFGANLAPSTATAQSVPLPRTLAGTSVTVGGLPAPLFYVSPTQINFQVPSALRPSPWEGSPQYPLVVSTPAGVSAVFTVDVAPYAAEGIFTISGAGCGPGAVLNHTAEGVSLNSPENSAEPGSYISIYLTGSGPASFAPPDGGAAQLAPPLATTSGAGAGRLGLFGRDLYLPKEWSGRAPGQVGVDQVVVKLPDDAPEGCAVPLWTESSWHRSQPVAIAIRRGGGRCQDSPIGRSGSVYVRHRVVSAPDKPVDVKTTVEAAFEEAPHSLLAAGTPEREWQPGSCICPTPGVRPAGPSCAGATAKTASAGALRIELPGSDPLVLQPQVAADGNVRYSGSVLERQLAEGQIRIAAEGGAIGAFTASAPLRPPIRITTSLPPGTHLPIREPFRLAWTGGTSDMLVRMRMNPSPEGGGCECFAVGDQGFVQMPVRDLTVNGVTTRQMIVRPSPNYSIEVTVAPRPGPVKFRAPGMTLDGTLTWVQEYVYTGIRVQ